MGFLDWLARMRGYEQKPRTREEQWAQWVRKRRHRTKRGERVASQAEQRLVAVPLAGLVLVLASIAFFAQRRAR